MSLKFQQRIIDDVLIADLSGKLIEKSQVDELDRWITDQIEQQKHNFVFNLNDMDYINSTGLNLFIQLFTRIRNNGGELVFCCVPEKINKLLLITKLNKIFNIKPKEEEALAFFKS